MNKKFLLTLSIVGVALIGAGLIARQIIKPPIYIEKTSPFNRPDAEREIKQHADAIRRIQLEGEHRRKAWELAAQGQYDEAIVELHTALKYTNQDGTSDQWVTRRALAEIYEKAGKYDLAMKELEWAESVQTRPDVLKKLAEDRKRLEQLIQHE